MNKPTVSIVITTYKRDEYIKKLIRSIEETTPDEAYEIVVVSSDPPDSDKVKWLENRPRTRLFIPDVRTGERKRSSIYYYNLGISKATMEWVFPLNDDMALKESWYENFVSAISREENGNAGVVIVATHLADPVLGHRVALQGRTKRGDGGWKDLYLTDFNLVKKEVFDAVGGYDESIDWFGSGLDFGLAVSFLTDKDIIVDESIKLDHYLAEEHRQESRGEPSAGFLYVKNKWDEWCLENNASYEWILYNDAPLHVRNNSNQAMQRATWLHSEGRHPEELDTIVKALENDPFYVDLNYLYAQSLIGVKQFPEAEKQLKRVIAVHGSHTYAQNDLGVICQQRGDFNQAIERYKIAVSIDNKNYGALKNLIGLLIDKGRNEEAKNIAERILMQHPADQTIFSLIEGLVPEIQKEFSSFINLIHPLTKSGHDVILAWAEDCEHRHEELELEKFYGNSDNALVSQGFNLAKEVKNLFANKLKQLEGLRILLHVPPLNVSPGGYSLFTNMLQALQFIGIETMTVNWDRPVKECLDAFRPSVFMTSDHAMYLSRIDWDAIKEYKKTHGLKVGLTASLQEYGNTPLSERLKWAQENEVDFYYSFRAPEYVRSRKEYMPFFEAGYQIFNIEFAANPLIHYPVPNVRKDLDYVFLGSSNWDKIPRYVPFMKNIVSRHAGLIDGPGWGFKENLTTLRKDRYLYARAKVGLNVHLPEQITWASELNERTYILAACGIPQLIDAPKLLPSRLSEGGLFVGDTPEKYNQLFEFILVNPQEAEKRALAAQKEVFEHHTWFHRAEKFALDVYRAFFSKSECGLIYDTDLHSMVNRLVRGNVARVGGAVQQLLQYRNCAVTDINLADGGYGKATSGDHTIIMDIHDALRKSDMKEKFDCLISSNVIEHSYNPILFLLNCHFVTKESGYQFHAIPNYRYTYDVFRRPTSLEHMIEDFENFADSTDHSHNADYVQSAVEKHGWQREYHKKYPVVYPYMHYHVFDEFNTAELMRFVFQDVTTDVIRTEAFGDSLVFFRNTLNQEFFNRYGDLISRYFEGGLRKHTATVPKGDREQMSRRTAPTNGTRHETKEDDSFLERIKAAGKWAPGQPLKLHLGCGENHFEDYVNIDYPPSEHTVQTGSAADVLADIRAIRLPARSVDEVRLHHVFEHFNRPQSLALLIRWQEWLKVGGTLRIETPDVIGSARTLLSDVSLRVKQGVIRHLFGSHEAEWAYHYDGWSEEKFKSVLSKLGFTVKCQSYRWQGEPFLSNVEAIAVKKKNLSRIDLIAAADEVLLDSMVADVPNERMMWETWRTAMRRHLAEESPDEKLASRFERLTGLKVYPDSPGYVHENDDLQENGEYLVASKVLRPNDVVFDIGANVGKWSRFVLSQVPGVKVYAFEPGSKAFSKLKDSLGGSGSFAFQMAMSDKDEVKTFYHYTDGDGLSEASSFYRRYSLDQRPDLRFVPVKTMAGTIASFCRDNSIEKISFAKIDTEGAEADVLEGARELLQKQAIGMIQFEYGGTYFDANKTLRQIWDLLYDCGYDFFRIVPDGLMHVSQWRDSLEDYRYANFLAVASGKEDGVNVEVQLPEVAETAAAFPRVLGLIFSKDRAMQLDCTMRSLGLHCRDLDTMDLRVIYTTSGPLHERQYAALAHDYPSVRFVKEHLFKKDVLRAMSTSDYVSFFVDDNIFVRDFSIIDAVKSLKENEKALGFSLRLGKNTKYCYMLDKPQALPDFSPAGEGKLSYEWPGRDGDFGYPLELSSSIYRSSEMASFLGPLEFTNPNTMELMMDSNKAVFRDAKNRLMCYASSVTYCNPVNKVQTLWANRSGDDTKYSVNSLAKLFDQGLRVDVESYSGTIPDSCHQEMDLRFAQEATPIRNEADQAPLVSILIPNYNGRKDVELCLGSIERNTPENHEIVVLDNGSTDGSREYLRTVPNIILLENPHNIGVAARAQLLSMARGQHVVFLDNDTIVTKDWLKKFISHAEKDHGIGLIGPRSNYVSGPQLVPDAKYNTIEELERFAGAFTLEHQGEVTSIVRMPSFCWFFTKKVVDTIGATEVNFGKFGFEDDDYNLRVHIAGFKSVIAHDVFVHHTGGPQGRGNEQYNKEMLKSWELFKKKWGLPSKLKYGESFDLTNVLAQRFKRSKHFNRLPERSAVEKLIYLHEEVSGRPEEQTFQNTVSGSDLCHSDRRAESSLYHQRAVLLKNEGKSADAISALRDLLEFDPEYGEALNDLGVLLFEEGRKDEGLPYVRRAVAIAQNNLEYLRNFGAMLFDLGMDEEATDIYTRILDMEAQDTEALLVLGILSFKYRQAESARTFLNSVLLIDKDNQVARSYLDKIGEGFNQEALNVARS
jgi:FkbM family methyltransferase